MAVHKKLNVVGIIPARMGSSRFPGKPLARINGIPMLGHVYFRSKMCRALTQVCVATCDREISDYVLSIGGAVVMTSSKHERASDRAAEALFKMEEDLRKKIDIVVMIQGDEPMLYPEMIEESLMPMMSDNAVEIVNLMSVIKSREEQDDPNVVKVVVNLTKGAMYFSREPVPSRKKAKIEIGKMYKQVPVIAFRRDFLIRYNELAPTPLEIIESVDMLRVLEYGYSVKMVETKFQTYGVDTLDDLKKVERLMCNDKLFPQYAGSHK